MTSHSIKWSWKLTRIAGIDVFVHLTFFLLLLWISLSVWKQTGNSAAVLQGLLFVLLLFACVVMHEFGHALTARRFGIVTRRITLLPIGGVASMEKMPEDPRQEIQVALAGPAVNLVIAGAIGSYLYVTGTPLPTVREDTSVLFTSSGELLFNIMVINIVLGIFNLLPAFPMDGGRVLRAGFALSMPHHQATEKAAAVGQTLAIAMFVLGLLYNPLLMLISVFIWLGAAAEAGQEKLQFELKGVSARHVMLTRFDTLSPQDTLARAIDLSIHTGQQHFPVRTHDGWALLTHQRVLALVREHGEQVRLADVTLPALPVLSPQTPAEQLLQHLSAAGVTTCGISEQGQLCGLVSISTLLEWPALHQHNRTGM